MFVATQPIDFRRGVHGLVALVAEGLGGKPYSGDVFVFRSKRKDRLKLLVFDGSGLVLATKSLEDGDFAWPPVREGTMRVTGAQLAMLIEGLSEWSRVVPKVRKRPTKVAWIALFCWRLRAFSDSLPIWRFAPKISPRTLRLSSRCYWLSTAKTTICALRT